MRALPRTTHYHAYLLRCWAEHDTHSDTVWVWRFSLEDPHTSERRGFATLELLLHFLRQATQLEKEEIMERKIINP
jgi:hypothetical protein